MSTTTRLSAVETSFITGETNARPAHIGNLAVFESSPDDPLTYDAVKKLVAERIDLVPAFRRRIVQVPFGLDRPYAVDNEFLDIEFHVRQIAVPSPGAREQLAEIVARLHARRLDRSRPLWEVYVIDGLAGGQVGLYSKVHFVALDPAHGTEIMTALLDPTPDGRAASTPPAPLRASRAPRNWRCSPVPASRWPAIPGSWFASSESSPAASGRRLATSSRRRRRPTGKRYAAPTGSRGSPVSWTTATRQVRRQRAPAHEVPGSRSTVG